MTDQPTTPVQVAVKPLEWTRGTVTSTDDDNGPMEGIPHKLYAWCAGPYTIFRQRNPDGLFILRGKGDGFGLIAPTLEAAKAAAQADYEARMERRLAPEQAEAEAARLTEELARLRADRDQGAKDYCDLMGQRDALHVRAKALEAALRPFVAYIHDDLRKGKATYELVAVDRAGGGLIGAEDLRRARAVLNPTGD